MKRSCLWVTAVGCLALAACVPPFPLQASNLTLVEHFTQRFLVQQETNTEKNALYRFLVGPDATAVLTSVRAFSAPAAAKQGTLSVRGSLMITVRLDPYDPRRFSVAGLGDYAVYGPVNQEDFVSSPIVSGHPKKAGLPITVAGTELLFDAHFEIGNTDMHALSDLHDGQIILPITHMARINPVLLTNRTAAGEGPCVIETQARERGSVSCNAPGVGSPYTATYYVRVHVREIEDGKLYAIARDREHEIFRVDERNQNPAFGCLSLGADRYFPEIFDLRGLEHVARLEDGVPPLAPRALYDRWHVEDSCRASSPVGQNVAPAPANTDR